MRGFGAAARTRIDMARRRFLNFMDFVSPVFRDASRRAVLVIPIVLGMAAAGCSHRSTPAPVEDTQTSGRISLVCASEAHALIDHERRAFEALYPQASFEVRAGTSREAIRQLFAAQADLAVITRDLAPEERAAAVRGKLDLEGYRFARDAVVIVVHAENPVQNLTLEEVRRIYEGDVKSWRDFGGRDAPIVPVVQPGESDITEYFMLQVMSGSPIQARSLTAAGDSEAVATVAARPGAVAYVSLAWADRGARALRLAPIKGLSYWKPDLEAVYRGDYPLTRFFSLYVRASGRKLANGLITFVTSMDGQRLVQESGLVPTAVPVRFVRRSPLLGAH